MRDISRDCKKKKKKHSMKSVINTELKIMTCWAIFQKIVHKKIIHKNKNVACCATHVKDNMDSEVAGTFSNKHKWIKTCFR